MDVQEEYFENTRPFLQKLQSCFASIRLQENLSVKVLIESEKNTLKIYCNVFKGYLPLTLGLLQYDAIFPLLDKKQFIYKEGIIQISDNRHVLYKLQYNNCSSKIKAQMVKQKYDSIMESVKKLTHNLLEYLDFPKYISQQRKSTFNKILSMIGQSSFQQLNQYDINLYLDKYCQQAQKSKKNNTQMAFTICFKPEQVQKIKQMVRKSMNNKITQSEFFALTNVIFLDHQKYQTYADDLQWKIKVFFNLCVKYKSESEKIFLNDVLILVNQYGDVKIEKEKSQNQYLNKNFDKNLSEISNVSKRKSFDIAKIMYLLFVGQFPQSSNSDTFFEPTYGLIDEWKKQPVHQCLWKLFTKCFSISFKATNNKEQMYSNIPHLDWVIAILNTILVEIYEKQKQKLKQQKEKKEKQQNE